MKFIKHSGINFQSFLTRPAQIFRPRRKFNDRISIRQRNINFLFIGNYRQEFCGCVSLHNLTVTEIESRFQ